MLCNCGCMIEGMYKMLHREDIGTKMCKYEITCKYIRKLYKLL